MKKVLFLFSVCIFGSAISGYSQPAAEVKNALGEAAGLMRTGNFSEAEKLLQQARKAAPRNGDVYNLLGIVYDQKGDYKQAETAYLTAIKLNPKSVSPLANLGVLLVKLKREKEAVEIFENVLRINPNHPQSIINLGFLYSSAGDFGRAADFLRQADQFQPDSPDILFKLGAALYQTKKFGEARQIFARLPVSAETHYHLGLIAFAENSLETARESFVSALALNPQLADADFMLGEIFAKQGRYREAIPFYEKAVAQDKTRDVYFVRLGGTFLLVNEVNKAFQIFRDAVGLFPKIPEIRYFLAVTLRAKGDYDPAIAEIKRALVLKETADSNALLGAILADRDQSVEAEKYLRRAGALNPNHFNSHYDLGRLLVKRQKFAAALPFLQKAAELMPRNADVHYQLFLTYSRLKRKAEADQELALFKQLSEKK